MESIVMRDQSWIYLFFRISRVFVLISFLLIFGTPVYVTGSPESSINVTENSPKIIIMGVYVIDFTTFSIQEGTVQVDYYMSLKSDTPVSLNNIELINGVILSEDLIHDTPNLKYYRIHAIVRTDLTLHDYPFDSETIRIEFEPKDLNEDINLLVIDLSKTGMDPNETIEGWTLARINTEITSELYPTDEVPYKRAIFKYEFKREALSNMWKFFLPIFLIVLVSLISLVMKVTSRLSLNSSMFLAAVLIHWRVVSDLPNLSYGVFLDIFMVITYATLIMVLISGILRIHFTDSGQKERAAVVHRFALWFIPLFCLVNYLWLFYSLQS